VSPVVLGSKEQHTEGVITLKEKPIMAVTSSSKE